MTTGRLVSDIFTKYLNNIGGSSKEDIVKTRLVFAKLSTLNPDHRYYEKNKKIFQKCFTQEINNLTDGELEILFDQNIYKLNGISNATILTFIITAPNSFLYTSGIIYGGRANNERFKEYTLSECCCDVDLVSCYGGALRSLYYPLGVPTYYYASNNEKQLTLGLFFESYGDELVDNLYTIHVSGELPFDQDLILSRVMTQIEFEKFSKKNIYNVEDDEKVAGYSCFLRREIIHGCITSDILECLKKVSTKSEYSYILNCLNVESAVFYKKSDRILNFKEFRDDIIKSENMQIFDIESQCIKDKRSRKWYGVKLEGFVGKMVDERLLLKRKYKETKDPIHNATNEALKLIVNALYGVTASRFFTINNCVVANNITARARLGAWMMAKSLGLVQTITDGGFFSPRYILSLEKKTRLPGLESMSSYYKLVQHRSIKLKSLGDIDWNYFINNFGKNKEYDYEIVSKIDNIILKHITQFFSNYNLPFKFNVEVKIDNFSNKIVFFQKAHYGLLKWDPNDNNFSDLNFKIRGARVSKEFPINPYFKIMAGILNNNSFDKKIKKRYELFYVHSEILRFKSWKNERTKYIGKWNKKDENLFSFMEKHSANFKSVLPGNAIYSLRKEFHIHDTFLPLNDSKEFIKKEKEKSNPIPKYEKFLASNFDLLWEKLQNQSLAGNVSHLSIIEKDDDNIPFIEKNYKIETFINNKSIDLSQSEINELISLDETL